ncbi:MAG TPA: PAS domain-containing sensor histidine kinase [Pedobacter sp.]|jgi:PAS domain S-box-containing protein
MSTPSSNPYFEDLFSNTSDLIHFANLEGKVEVANPAWLSVLGYSLEEVLGSSIYDYVWPSEISKYRSYREQCLANVILDDIQVSFKRKDGQRVFLEGHLRAYYNADQHLHTRGVFRDITLKQKKQRENEEQFEKINNFLKNAPDAVIVINEKQLVVEWNLKAETIFGYSKEEALHQPLSDLIIPLPYREMHKQGMQHFLKTGEGPVLNRTIEVSAINKNQQEFPISLNISNVKLDDNWFFIAFMDDITDRRKEQAELLEQKKELDDVKLEDQRTKEFLNIASHELKTPLTSIKAFTQLALRGLGKQPLEQTGDYLIKIDEASNKLKKLVMDLLDISKINEGKLQINKTSVKYGSFVREIIRNLQIIFPSHNIELECNDNDQVALDPLRVEQVITNLISNAVKYSPDSDIIEVSTKVNHHTLITSVRDFGIGIDGVNEPKVFDKFYQIEEISKTDNSGLGLGLFICSEIVKLHGGSIWLESTKGNGTTFYFTLPI